MNLGGELRGASITDLNTRRQDRERDAMPQEEERYLTAVELAGLPGMPTTKRGVNMRANEEAWPWRKRPGNGGGREFPLSCLPAVTQAALAEKVLSAAPEASSSSSIASGALFSSTRGTWAAEGVRTSASGSTPDPRSESLGRIFESRSQKQQARARAALEAVELFYNLKHSGYKSTAAIAAVCTARGISAPKLWNAISRVRGEPRDVWLYLLLDGRNGRTARAEITPEAWDVLMGAYLSRPARTAQACIHRLREANKRGGFGWIIPSDRTLLRRLQGIPRDVRVLAREGRDELLRSFPPQQRVKAALGALDIVNGDGYKHAGIWVAYEDGRIARACTWFWQDVYSSKILAWRTDETEHTDLVRLSFGDVCATYGIPRAVLQDNTRAAANKTMSGGVRHRYRFKVKDEEPDGVFKLLGVERVMWATPAHGQAKPVERVFGIGGVGEHVDRAPEFSGRYDEAEKYNGKTKPVPIAELERVIAREVAAMNARTGRRGAVHKGRSWDEVFAESYAHIVARKATAEQQRLWLLCTEPKKVQRNGTLVLDAGRMVGEHRANRYWCRELGEHAGRMVAARFDPARLHEGVHVYTADGRYIAFAECLEPAGFNDQNAARDHARDRSRFVRATREALNAERRMSARAAGELLAAARSGCDAQSLPAPKVVQGVFRDPLERPRYVPREQSAEERAELERLEQDYLREQAAQPEKPIELMSEMEQFYLWKKLHARRNAGETLDERMEAFYAGFESTGRKNLEDELAFERRNLERLKAQKGA